MSLADTNSIIRAYLASGAGATAGLVAMVGTRIYVPRLPENAVLPAIGFFTRGGTSSPYIPDLPVPSVQFDCWADNPITARNVYRKLYDALQGIQHIAVTILGTTYYIESAIEEVQGQDLMDNPGDNPGQNANDIPNYFRVLTFFNIMVKI